MSEEIRENIHDVNLTSEMKDSFIDYAMSVIVARALPDVRDGLETRSSPYFIRHERIRCNTG